MRPMDEFDMLGSLLKTLSNIAIGTKIKVCEFGVLSYAAHPKCPHSNSSGPTLPHQCPNLYLIELTKLQRQTILQFSNSQNETRI